jgi:phenylacetate-CoA ligase
LKPQEKLETLNQILNHCKSSPFYKDRIPSQPLRSLEELKNIPLTTKEDLTRHSPFGLLCVSRRELYQYHESSGTTGIPVSSWFTEEDILDNAREIAECGVNFNEGDIVLVRFPYSLTAAAHMTHAAAQLNHACVIPAGKGASVTPFPRLVNLMQKLEVTVLTCLSLQAVMIAETAEMLGLKPNRDFPRLRAICNAGEPLTSGRRKLLEDMWGVQVFDFYGMTEIGTAVVDCEYGQPHPLEDYFIIELLREDLKTDVKPGEMGYLVVTTLKKRATPMIRYLTGDRARMVEKKCACGGKISLEVRGRKEDTIAVNERIFDLWDLEEIVSNLPCRRFWVAGPAREGLHFVVEQENKGDKVSTEQIRMLEKQHKVKLFIEIVPKGTLYDRNKMLTIGLMGKPHYIYSTQEMEQKTYMKSSRS